MKPIYLMHILNIKFTLCQLLCDRLDLIIAMVYQQNCTFLRLLEVFAVSGSRV